MRDDDKLKMEQIARELRKPVRMDSSIDARVMHAVRRMPRHSRFGLWSRLTTPRSITVIPLSWGLLAAGLVLFAAVGAAAVSVNTVTPAPDLVHMTAAQRVEASEVGPGSHGHEDDVGARAPAWGDVRAALQPMKANQPR